MKTKDTGLIEYNCRVTLGELANNFIRVGKDFELLAQKESNELDFGKSYVEIDSCGTVACHGGWGVVLYAPSNEVLDYEEGAGFIENQLGFDIRNGLNLEIFAEDNPEWWGNDLGRYMFGGVGYEAFGFEWADRDECTLESIGNHYIEVGNRILNYIENK